MKPKLSLLIILIILASAGIAALQVRWLTDSYKISKEKISTEARKVLDEAIIEHKDLVAERVRKLLKKVINPEDIETAVHWKMPDSQHVSLGYRTKRSPQDSWMSFKVLKKDLKQLQSNPYPLLLKSIDKGNLEALGGIYTSFVGIVSYKPNSWEDKLQDSLMHYFSLHEDTATLNKIVKKHFDKIGWHFATRVVHQKGIDGIYDKNSVINHSTVKQVQMVSTEKRWKPLTENLDSLNSYIRELNKSDDQICIAKPILDDINTILRDEMLIIFLVVELTPSQILSRMLFGLFGSISLLFVIGFSLTYMFYTIIKQKQLSEIKDDFIGNVSHELKTPVATTLAAIHGMQHFDVLKNPHQTELYLSTAAKEMQRLSAMIDNILNSSIYERRYFTIHPVNFNLKDMLTELINVQELHAKKEVTIDLNYQAREEIFSDKTHLYNVFINLLDNSIKYGRHQVEIKIECFDSTVGLKIQLSDNGQGIPALYQKNIFDKFFRVPNPNDHTIKGHGLGLSYVKNILEKHKGSIKLLKSDDTGSTFEINLPQ